MPPFPSDFVDFYRLVGDVLVPQPGIPAIGTTEQGDSTWNGQMAFGADATADGEWLVITELVTSIGEL